MSGTRWLALAALSILTVLASPVRAEDQPVDLELVLAVDVSMSMDMGEQKLQRDGYVAALKDPEVLAAISDGVHRRIAVTYVEWAGTGSQQVLMPWTLIDGPAPATAFADKLATMPVGRMRRTSISSALEFTGRMFEESGFEGMRRVIDVSGDGPNNQGVPVTLMRDTLASQGVVINGLAIMIGRSGGFGSMFDIARLDEYYEDCVIGGPGAFVVSVTDKREFAAAIRRKMILEIAGIEMRALPIAARQPADCLIGERQWQYWMERQE